MLRDELRQPGMQVRLADIRQAMRQADALIRRGRKATLDRAGAANGLQKISQMPGLAASFAVSLDMASARAIYAASEEASAARSYSVSANTYIQVIRQGASVST